MAGILGFNGLSGIFIYFLFFCFTSLCLYIKCKHKIENYFLMNAEIYFGGWSNDLLVKQSFKRNYLFFFYSFLWLFG